MRNRFTALSSLLVLSSAVAWAGVHVTTPQQNAQVNSPFMLAATATGCHLKKVSAMGYSLDTSPDIATVKAQSVLAKVSASVGDHTVRVKAWNSKGGVCNQDVKITVLPITPPPPPVAAAPIFSLPAGTYESAQTVSISDATPGAQILYSVDGTVPSLAYAAPIAVASSETLKAIATAAGYTPSPETDAAYVISVPPPPAGPVIPPDAKVDTDIQARPDAASGVTGWHWNHDPATPGSSTGTSLIVATPSLSGHAREFNSTFTGSGGEIFSVSYDHDGTSLNFVYDVYVQIKSGSVLTNLEMDSNQVMPDGQLFIFGFQCAGTSGVWEFGGPWVKSSAPCDPNKWTKDVWHHVQVSYSRDAAGIAYYHSVWLDGVEAKIDGQQHSLRATKWGANIIQTQFQIDGKGASGSSTLYADQMKVYHW